MHCVSHCRRLFGFASMSCCKQPSEAVDPWSWWAPTERDLDIENMPSLPFGGIDDSYQQGLSGSSDSYQQGLSGMRMVGENPPIAERSETSGSLLLSPCATDKQLMRCVSLRKTLFHAYSFWFASPHARCQAQKKHLFRSSVQTNGFDMFLSHTWNTQGGWKFLSLFLQFGWPTILCCWAFGVILGFALCMLNIIPLFELCHHTALGFTGVIPSSCWIQIFGLLGILLGCLLFPHLPFCKKDKCFLDFACINQTDETKMAEGIMSISAFLVASKELRVLWSPPLLSRLWCVFEIAAYRKLNPTGKIVIAPVDNEKSACMLLLWWQISCLAYWKARAGPEGGNPTALLVVGASFFLVLIPAAGHALWQSQKSSNQLRSDLANFDVTQVSCSCDFDRECIHGAITAWYGSLEAFSAHMRGPFSQEVLELMRMSGTIASQYIYLPMTPGVCLSLDKVLALVKAGAPAQPVLSVFFSHVVSLNLLYFPAVAVFWIWAAKRGLWLGSRRLPSALEISMILVLCIISALAGTYSAVILSANSLESTLLWNCLVVVFAGLVWHFCWHAK